jgi:type VI protein secretion system component VasK
MPTPPDPLDPLLDLWKEPSDQAPNLAPEVWRRIMLEESGSREGFWAEAAAWLSRPPFAAMFVASCALLGLFLAEVRVNREQRAQSSQLARSYLQLIDPLLKADAGGKLP